jgi:hypothetical protein
MEDEEPMGDYLTRGHNFIKYNVITNAQRTSHQARTLSRHAADSAHTQTVETANKTSIREPKCVTSTVTKRNYLSQEPGRGSE